MIAGPLSTRDRPARGTRGEQGSALIIATLVSVILALLGISYLMMGQTERSLAENERNAATALYVAEAGARLVVQWFNDPTSTGYLVPTLNDVDRTQRVFDHDADPRTARVQCAAGNAARPIYKDAALTNGGIFDRPYRSSVENAFLGVETGIEAGFPDAGPDLVVGAAHLTTINDALFPNFPKPDLRARVSRIEIYAPPTVTIGGTAMRLGIATIKVTAGVFTYPGTADERQIATRVVKAVVSEIPIPRLTGPLQSCAALSRTGGFEVHWGTASAAAGADLPSDLDARVSTGVPYAQDDPGAFYADATPHSLRTWAEAMDGRVIEDPWFKFIAGGAIAGSPNSNRQPWPFTYPGDGATGHSNLFQNIPVDCPSFDYDLWKSIAQGGQRGTYYFSWSGDDLFRLDGTGAAETLAQATSGRSGIFFFDTRDGRPPRGVPSDSWPTTNLTPGISLDGSSGWTGLVGFAYLNMAGIATSGAGPIGATRTVVPPGELFDGSGFVNLEYPTSLAGSYTVRSSAPAPATFLDVTTHTRYCVDAVTCTPGSWTPSAVPVRDATGLPFQTPTVLDGVVYNSGSFTTGGNAVFFGSVVAQQGVLDGGGNPGFYFDESLLERSWPRAGMDMPRVIISSWQTDP
jgi:hypothetical protein